MMQVQKRDGRKEVVKFDKILSRIKKMTYELDTDYVDAWEVTKRTIDGLYDGISTEKIDNLAAETAAQLTVKHPDYSYLASRIVISSMHKHLKRPFSQVIEELYNYVHPETGMKAGLVSDHVYKFVMENKEKLNESIVFDRDYNFDYFGLKTLERSYLLKLDKKIAELPQHLYMRVACGIWEGNIDEVIKTYEALSNHQFTHATPTLFNAGTVRPQLSSCFLVGMQEDSLEGIFKTLTDVAKISKTAGGIGLHVHNIRSEGSYIKGTNGVSNGIIPMLKVFNETARYVDQCFDGDVLIQTENGTVKISDISIGDMVLTHDGTFQEVENILSKEYSGKITIIENSSGYVKVTPEHPFLVLRNKNNELDFNIIKKDFDAGLLALEWLEAKHIEENDFIIDAPPCNIPSSLFEEFAPSGNKNYFYYDSKFFKRVLRKEFSDYSGHVYDLVVKNNHSYVTEIGGAAHNGGGKRKGSIAIYIEPWHADIEPFLDLRKNQGKEEMRARDLFLALWTPDLFMQRVEDDAMWSLFSPDEAPGLADVYGDDFKVLYEKYESEGRARKEVKARDLWTKVTDSMLETGTPYILYKDAANKKSNQRNLGTIKSSNLCAEILEYSDKNETAVCNLASISLPSFIDGYKKMGVIKSSRNKMKYNYQRLYDMAYQTTINLDRVIDINYYPTPETRVSNMKHRPIGIGVQGLADTYSILGCAFESDEARDLNNKIFETIYFAFLNASCDLARKAGKPYESYSGSPISNGEFQFDSWGVNSDELSGLWNWDELKEKIKKYGIRNSLGLCAMPTASTSQLLGNNEAIEPFTSNIYSRSTLSGNFVVINKYLVKDLIEIGLWTDDVRNKIILEEGSIQNVPEIPTEIKERYKTVWEIKQKELINQAADRGKFICQTQSMNLFFTDPNPAKVTSAMFYGWKKGLKTGIYYTRTKAATSALKGLGVDMSKQKLNIEPFIENSKPIVEYTAEEAIACSLDNPDDCIACSS